MILPSSMFDVFCSVCAINNNITFKHNNFLSRINMIFRNFKRKLTILAKNYARNQDSLKFPDCPASVSQQLPNYIQLSGKFEEFSKDAEDLIENMKVYENFVNIDEENSILSEIEPYMKRLRYEFDHWDDAIHGYRETERLQWNLDNAKILDRVRNLAFPADVAQLKFVHILDLAKDGYIKPHIDAVRFCGNTIAGLSLLTDSVMRLIHDENKKLVADILLKRRSLYVMKNTARYKYTHEILSNKISIFKGESVLKDRRISVICRNEPNKDVTS